MHTKGEWVPWDLDHALQTPGAIALRVRADELARVYAVDQEGEALLVGYGIGQLEITAPAGYREVRCICEGNVWLQQIARDQTVFASSDLVFTTLDRPPALSPEMQAIQRLSRANELWRERLRAELMVDARDRRATSELLEETPTEAPEAKRKRGRTGSNDGSAERGTSAVDPSGDVPASAETDDVDGDTEDEIG